jgi:hypothetical protein
MALSAGAKNLMLDALGAAITHLGLADAGDELASGGDYARQAVAFDAAAAGVLAMSAPEVFNIDGGSTINQVIFRDTATIDAGTDHGFAPLTEEVFGGDGTYTLTALTITASDA